MKTKIRKMTIADYDEAYKLWAETEGMSLEDDDTRERISLYLARNRGLCFVAAANDAVVGTALCGHEGRRGILRHLAVKREFRGEGIARRLVNECLKALARDGIKKCNIYVVDKNPVGLRFWEHLGWHRLDDDFRMLQTTTNTQA